MQHFACYGQRRRQTCCPRAEDNRRGGSRRDHQPRRGAMPSLPKLPRQSLCLMASAGRMLVYAQSPNHVDDLTRRDVENG